MPVNQLLKISGDSLHLHDSKEVSFILTHFYYHSPTKYQELVKNAHYNF